MKSYPSQMGQWLPQILPPVWDTFMHSSQVYPSPILCDDVIYNDTLYFCCQPPLVLNIHPDRDDWMGQWVYSEVKALARFQRLCNFLFAYLHQSTPGLHSFTKLSFTSRITRLRSGSLQHNYIYQCILFLEKLF